MSQMLRVGALGLSVFTWVFLTLIAMPAIEGGGDSPLPQLAVAAAFVLWLGWAAVGLAYDRRRRRRGVART